MNQPSDFALDYALDQLETAGSWLVLKRPQEWSVSLAKALCMSEELFQVDFTASVWMQKARVISDKRH